MVPAVCDNFYYKRQYEEKSGGRENVCDITKITNGGRKNRNNKMIIKVKVVKVATIKMEAKYKMKILIQKNKINQTKHQKSLHPIGFWPRKSDSAP